MDAELKEYRKYLIQTIQKLNENYDKLLITLSGGSLVLSLAFIKDIVGSDQIQSIELLLGAWSFFILSLTAVLGALLFGIAAHRKAISQVDSDKIYHEKPGGAFSKLTHTLHYCGTIFLIAGFILITLFVYNNMEVKDVKRETTTAPKTFKALKTLTDSAKKR